MNVPMVRGLLGVSELQLGVVIAAGMWSYAVTAPVTGGLVSSLGGWKAFQLGAAGAGMANLCVLLVQAASPASGGWPLTIGLAVCYGVNLAFQGFGTTSALALISTWYSPSERGLFSGIFNVWIVRCASKWAVTTLTTPPRACPQV